MFIRIVHSKNVSCANPSPGISRGFRVSAVFKKRIDFAVSEQYMIKPNWRGNHAKIHPISVADLTILFSTFSPVLIPSARAKRANPERVNIPGSHQDELGCSGDWQPDCTNTQLGYDPEDDVWQGTFEIQPNNDDDKKGPRYKAALNGGWGGTTGRMPRQRSQHLLLLKPICRSPSSLWSAA
jgi:hypothetical protein